MFRLLRNNSKALCVVACAAVMANLFWNGSLTAQTPVRLTVPDTAVRISGFAAPKALVTAKRDGTVVGSVTANSQGGFEFVFGSQTPGIYNYSVFYEHLNGLRSVEETMSVSVQNKQTTDIRIYLRPLVLPLLDDEVVQGGILQVRGHTAAGGKVVLTIDENKQELSATADSSGFYEFLIDTKNLNTGRYHFKITATKDGLSSDRTSPVSFTVHASNSTDADPTDDVTVQPEQLPPPTVSSPQDGETIEGKSVTIYGRSSPGSQVNIYTDDNLIASVLTGEDGSWNYNYTANTPKVSFSFSACIESRCSIITRSITVSFAVPDSCSVELELSALRFWDIAAGSQIELEVIRASGNGEFTIDWGNDSTETYSHDGKLPRVFRGRYDFPGLYQGKITYRQYSTATTRACSAERVFSINVRNELSKSDFSPALRVGIFSLALVSVSGALWFTRSKWLALLLRK